MVGQGSSNHRTIRRGALTLVQTAFAFAIQRRFISRSLFGAKLSLRWLPGEALAWDVLRPPLKGKEVDQDVASTPRISGGP